MRLALTFLVCFAAYCSAAEKVEQELPRPYALYPHYGQSPYNLYNPVDQRLFRPSTTTTTISTSTSTIICTKFTNVNCPPGRRRRSVLESVLEESNEQQFPIVPTAVAGVEPTNEPSRDARDANSELYLLNSGAFAYPESAFYSGPYNYRPAVLPFYDPYVNPLAGNRLFLTLPTWITRTFTSTSTVFAIFTSTSVPTCSIAGTLPQCPP